MAAEISRLTGDLWRNPSTSDSRDDNRRRSPRIITALQAMVRDRADRRYVDTVKTMDLSHGGMAITTEKWFEVGDEVEVDIECELPVQVYLGFEIDSLIVDGPVHRQLITVTGRVERVQERGDHRWCLGIKFTDDCGRENRELIQDFIDHVQTHEMWSC